MKWLSLLLVVSSFSAQAAMTSRQSILSFECTTYTSTAGRSLLTYRQDASLQVDVLRATGTRAIYDINSAGEIVGRQKAYMNLSGGPLAAGQFLTLVGYTRPVSGKGTWSGSVYLTRYGGSVFAPTLGGLVPIGTFSCPEFVVR